MRGLKRVYGPVYLQEGRRVYVTAKSSELDKVAEQSEDENHLWPRYLQDDTD